MAMHAMILVALLATSPASAEDAALRRLVERFEAARLGFDPAALEETLSPEYEEISSAGAVDSRAEVLAFYAPEAKKPAPPIQSNEVAVRSAGDTAVVTSRMSVMLPGGVSRSMRVRYVAHRSGGAWRLISTQYTPIPPARTQ